MSGIFGASPSYLLTSKFTSTRALRFISELLSEIGTYFIGKVCQRGKDEVLIVPM